MLLTALTHASVFIPNSLSVPLSHLALPTGHCLDAYQCHCLESSDTLQGSSNDLIYIPRKAKGLSNRPIRADEGSPPLPSSSTISSLSGLFHLQSNDNL